MCHQKVTRVYPKGHMPHPKSFSTKTSHLKCWKEWINILLAQINPMRSPGRSTVFALLRVSLITRVNGFSTMGPQIRKSPLRLSNALVALTHPQMKIEYIRTLQKLKSLYVN